MHEIVLLVDYENVGKINLNDIPDSVRVPFFFGASQKSVATDFLKAALKLGNRFIPIDIQGHGKNALDFHIAFYLGEVLTQSPNTSCVILSKDKGFDPLIKHLVDRGFPVKRAATLSEAFPAVTRKASTKAVASKLQPLEEAFAWLKGMQKNKRPRKRKGLAAHLYSHCAKKVPEAEIQVFIDNMIAKRQITITNETITYLF